MLYKIYYLHKVKKPLLQVNDLAVVRYREGRIYLSLYNLGIVSIDLYPYRIVNQNTLRQNLSRYKSICLKHSQKLEVDDTVFWWTNLLTTYLALGQPCLNTESCHHTIVPYLQKTVQYMYSSHDCLELRSPGLGTVGAVVGCRVDVPSPDQIPAMFRVNFKAEVYFARLSVPTHWSQSRNGFCITTTDRPARRFIGLPRTAFSSYTISVGLSWHKGARNGRAWSYREPSAALWCA